MVVIINRPQGGRERSLIVSRENGRKKIAPEGIGREFNPNYIHSRDGRIRRWFVRACIRVGHPKGAAKEVFDDPVAV